MMTRREASQLSSQAATLYKKETQKLEPCSDKCLNNGGNYVKK
jgi:hypothetical protein